MKTVHIWYQKPEFSRDLGMGLDFFKEHNPEAFRKMNEGQTPFKTHVHITSLDLTEGEGLDNIYYYMQGENWSPKGEKRDLIKSAGLNHTSMTIGDIIQDGDKFFFVNNFGFEELRIAPDDLEIPEAPQIDALMADAWKAFEGESKVRMI